MRSKNKLAGASKKRNDSKAANTKPVQISHRMHLITSMEACETEYWIGQMGIAMRSLMQYRVIYDIHSAPAKQLKGDQKELKEPLREISM